MCTHEIGNLKRSRQISSSDPSPVHATMFENGDASSDVLANYDTGLTRIGSNENFAFIRRSSLVELAMRMSDLDHTLDDTLQDLKRITQAGNAALLRSTSVESDDVVLLDELKKELEIAGMTTVNSSLEEPEPHKTFASRPSRLEQLRARNEQLRISGSRKLQDSRNFSSKFDESKYKFVEENSMSFPSLMSTSFDSRDDGMVSLCDGSQLSEESTEQVRRMELNESLSHQLKSLDDERNSLREGFVAAHNENQRIRRMFMALIFVTVYILIQNARLVAISTSTVSCSQASTDSIEVHPDDSVWTGTSVPELEPPTKIEPSISDDVVQISSNISFSCLENDLFELMSEEEISTEPIKSTVVSKKMKKLDRGALKHPVSRIFQALKKIGKKLIGDSEAGGVLDFKHNNVGVWAKSVA